MHRHLLIASLAGSILGCTLPHVDARNVPPDRSAGSTRVVTTTIPCDDEDDATVSITTTITSTADTTTATQTAYATADEGGDSSSESSTILSSWPTMLPAVPGNQPLTGLDSLAPSNNTKLTFTLDGNSDPSSEHLFAEMTANHTTPAVVLEHSQLIADVGCTARGLHVDLSTAAALDYVRTAWDTNFIAITSSVDCGSAPDGHHSYWNVTAATYPDDTLTARLDAVEVAIEDVLDEVHLIWGTHVPQNTTADPAAPPSTDSDDEDDDESDYLDFDDDFASHLQNFAPGLSTYAPEDYEGDDSPANGTAGGSDYDINDSGILRRQQPAPARKPYVNDDDAAKKEQNVQLADEKAEVQEKAYLDFEAILTKARQSAKKARREYFIAQQAAKAWPKDKVRAEEFERASATLEILNARVQQARDLALRQSKLVRSAKKAAAAAQSIADAAGTKGLPAGKKAKADLLVVARRIAEAIREKFLTVPVLRADAKTKATSFSSFLKDSYDQLSRNVRNIASGQVDLSPDYAFPINLWANKLREDDLVYTPWGQQYHMSANETQRKKLVGGKLNISQTVSTAYDLYCVDCGFKADIHISGQVSFNVQSRELTKGSITIDGGNIAASLFLGLEGYAKAEWKKSQNIYTQAIPPGFSIPKIITLGPAVSADASVTLRLEAEGILLTGADIKFSNFTAKADLVDLRNFGLTGFKPSFTPEFEAYGVIRAGVQLGFPLTIGVSIDIPMAKFKAGITMTSEPYIKGVASYGTSNNCSKGIDYNVRGGLDITADVVKKWKPTLVELLSPPITTGCIRIPVPEISIPKSITDKVLSGVAKLGALFGFDDKDFDNLIAEAKTATDPSALNDLRYDTITAGGGEWTVMADYGSGLCLVPTASIDSDTFLARSLFAYIDDVVAADYKSRPLMFFRQDLLGPRPFGVARLYASNHIGESQVAAGLIAVEPGDARDGPAVLVPADTEGNTFVPVACTTVDFRGDEENVLFIVNDADEGIKTLESNRLGIRPRAGGKVQECVQIAFDAPTETEDKDII